MNTCSLNANMVYSNLGNPVALLFLEEFDYKILDIGCGAGDTGHLIKSVFPNSKVTGITCSNLEYQLAKEKLDYSFYLDIERDLYDSLPYEEYDVLYFLHVLEHLVDPVSVIEKCLHYLKPRGKIIIALPNIAHWTCRLKLLFGNFRYTEGGVMDKTHLHFYTFFTASEYLIDPIKNLNMIKYYTNGHFPLGFLRKYFFTQAIYIDTLCLSWKPNLFGHEIIIYAIKK